MQLMKEKEERKREEAQQKEENFGKPKKADISVQKCVYKGVDDFFQSEYDWEGTLFKYNFNINYILSESLLDENSFALFKYSGENIDEEQEETYSYNELVVSQTPAKRGRGKKKGIYYYTVNIL